MKMSLPLQAMGLPAGFAGLLAGLLLLNPEPLFGVLGILSAMSLIFIAAAALCGTDVRRSPAAERKSASSDTARSGCSDQET